MIDVEEENTDEEVGEDFPDDETKLSSQEDDDTFSFEDEED